VIEGKVEGPSEYRKSILKKIKQYLNDNNDISDIIITEDFNQNIMATEMKQFYAEIGVEDIHSRLNNIPEELLEKTFINGSKPIDSIAASEGIFEYIEECQLLDYNQIIFSDHRSYIIDVNIKDYFNNQLSQWEKIKHVILNPTKCSH